MKTFEAGFLVAVLSASTFIAAPNARAATPYSDPFAVAETDSDQYVYDSAAGANGDVALLFTSGGAMFVWRFDATGRPLQSRPLEVGIAERIAVSGTGSFAVVGQTANGFGTDIVVSAYDRAGRSILAPTTVNPPNSEQRVLFQPAIAMNARGQFAVTWQRWAQSGSGTTATEMYARRYEPNGAPATSAILVRAAAMRVLGDDIGIDDRGNFTVIWNEVVANGFSADLNGRRFAANGVALSAPFLIAWDCTQLPTIAMNGAGAFVIGTSEEIPGPTETWGVFARRFSAGGAQLGSRLQVNVDTNLVPHLVDVGIAADGAFVVSWQQASSSGGDPVMLRSYQASGTAIDQPTVANGAQPADGATVAVDPAGNATVAWSRIETPAASTSNDVMARRFLPPGVEVTALANGQTVSGLSGAVGSWRYFKVRVEPGQNTFDVSMWGGGDADLYLRLGALPNLSQWDARPYLTGSNEAVRMLNFPPGDWYIGVRGYSAYSAVSLTTRAY